jgi:hypothetical protein
MDEAVEELGRLLYGGDDRALTDLRSALADWQPFYERHVQDIGIDMSHQRKVWEDGADPWEVLIDVGSLHKFVFEADCREFFDRIVAGVRSLRSANGLTVDWDTLAATDDEVEVEAFLGSLASQVRRSSRVLVILDKASDSFPLAILPHDAVERARELAAIVGDGEVVVVGDSAAA